MSGGREAPLRRGVRYTTGVSSATAFVPCAAAACCLAPFFSCFRARRSLTACSRVIFAIVVCLLELEAIQPLPFYRRLIGVTGTVTSLPYRQKRSAGRNALPFVDVLGYRRAEAQGTFLNPRSPGRPPPRRQGGAS